jgi:hypothetical protein
LPFRCHFFCLFASAGIPKCVRGNQQQGEEKKADDDEEQEEDPSLGPEEIALMDLSELDQQKVVAIKTSMSDATPEGGGELCYLPEDVQNIAQMVHRHVDSASLAAEHTPTGLAAMAFKMGVYCDFKPPAIVARFVQGIIWQAARRALAVEGFDFSQLELISHVKELGQAEDPPLTIQMKQTDLSQLWTLCEFIQNNDLQR